MSEALWASNSSSLIILPTSRPEQKYLESGITAESDIIEACECLKAWWKKDLIKQQED
jgi:hypothetical protein